MTTMYRTVIFFVFLYTALGTPDIQRRECFGVYHAVMICCNGITKLDITEQQKIEECYKIVKPGSSPLGQCIFESCVGQKFGYYGDHGLNKQAFASFVEKKFVMNKDLVAAVNENCINGDISKHGPADMCDIVQLQHCFDNELYKICPEWSNEGECNGFREAVLKCFSDY